MSNLATFRSTIETAWEAASPHVDGSGLSYAFINTLTEERGRGQHRQLIWRLPTTASVLGQGGTDTLQILWSQPCELFIHRRDQTYAAFVDDVCDDIVTLTAEWSATTALGAGVYEATLQEPTFEIEEDEPEESARAGAVPLKEVARVRFEFMVLTGES